MVVLAVVYAILHAVFPVVCVLIFRRFPARFSCLVTHRVTSDRCTVSTGDPQQLSHELLATGLKSLSMIVQAEPVKLVTGKLVLLLLPIVRSPGRVTRWAIKGSDIQTNIKILKIYHIGSA